MPGSTLFYRIAKIFFRTLFAIYDRASARGIENIPDGPAVVASNHASNIDPPLVGCLFPRPLRYLAKKELFTNRLMSAAISALGAIPVDREDAGRAGAALKLLLSRIEAGESVLVFPEGMRSLDGRIGALEGGASFLAVKAGVPIVPVYIAGSFKAFPPGSSFPRPVKLTVTFGRAIYPSADAADRDERDRMTAELDSSLRAMEADYIR